MDDSTEYLTYFDEAKYDAMLDAITAEEIERLSRLQKAQIIVIEKANPFGNEEVLHVCAVTRRAMGNDMDAPVEKIAQAPCCYWGRPQKLLPQWRPSMILIVQSEEPFDCKRRKVPVLPRGDK
jgi:hypothetical protein